MVSQAQIVGWDPWRNSLKVKLESKPEGGKANKELVSKLSKLTGHKITLVHGVTSKNKDIIIECTTEEFTELLNKFGAYAKDEK